MTPEQQKEEISKAYMHAVAAKCGYAIGTWSQDQSCIDTTIGASGVLGGGPLADPKLDIQIKCTSDQSVVRSDSIAWKLERRHYDRLRARSSIPKLLVVLVLPEAPAEWLSHSMGELVIRRCAYWTSLKGEPDIATDHKTVHIPTTNVFSPEGLKVLMEQISREELR